ncbi:hypothetical protein [Curtobacterium sp. UCD-KPL2560]|uniref:hypothetical protein n=1 Tax=Curtobacterium sp. UCD-KPL2560 TaxID=1885315 RepID=UPI00114CFD82|nr:hypothetical protein [Curtobacterium sp. UCD-KPL2560]
MAEHRWAPPEHQDVPVYAVESLPLSQIGEPVELDEPEPVWVDPAVFEHIGPLRVKAFAVARSDVAVYVQISWQGRLQRAWVRRDVVRRRVLEQRDGKSR